MSHPIVFFDIAGPDAGVLRQFYSELFGWQIGDDGRITAASLPELHGVIREDPPEKILYVQVPDLEDALASIQSRGGAVAIPPMTIPGGVTFAVFTDPAGNRMGLVKG